MLTMPIHSDTVHLHRLNLDASWMPSVYCWSLLDAVVKATGERLHARLDDFDVSLSPGETIRVAADFCYDQQYISWQLQSFEFGPRYTGAVATPARNDVGLLDHDEWRLGHA